MPSTGTTTPPSSLLQTPDTPVAVSPKDSRSGIPIEKLSVSAYTVPTDLPEADGTATWRETAMVLVEATAGNLTGLGYSYADTATAGLVKDKLVPSLPARTP